MKRLGVLVIAFLIFNSSFGTPTITETLKKYSLAISFVNNGENDKAITLLNQVISENPKIKYANVLLGICYFNKNKFQESAEKIKIFISDQQNATNKDDRYPLALVYYLGTLAKLNDVNGIKYYYPLIDKYPIPNNTGKIFTATTLVDAAGNTAFPYDLEKSLAQKSIEILEKNKSECEKNIWFYDAYGRALILKAAFENDLDLKANYYQTAITSFEHEIQKNRRCSVLLNYSVALRLMGENYILKFWKKIDKYKTKDSPKKHYSELKEMITTGLNYYKKSLVEIEESKVAPYSEGQRKRIITLENVTNQQIQDISSNPTVKIVSNSSSSLELFRK